MNAVSIIEGPVAHVPEADVDTDRILPARYLKRIERSGFGEFLFEDWAKDGGVDLASLRDRPILIAGENFGSGSSREHVPWALQDFGFEAIVAASLADIFRLNCAKIGLLAVELGGDECSRLAQVEQGRIDLPNQTMSFDGLDLAFEIDAETKYRLIGGLDDIEITLGHEEVIADHEASGINNFGPQIPKL